MYLRHSRVRRNGRVHTYWGLVRSVRVGAKVRQETVATLGGLDETGQDGHAFSVSWSPAGGWFASADTDGVVNLEQTGQSEVLRRGLQGHRSETWMVAWSPDGGRLASGSADGTVKIWDPTIARSGPDVPGESAAVFSTDGLWLAIYASDERAIHVREVEAWTIVASIPCETSVGSMTFDPSGQRHRPARRRQQPAKADCIIRATKGLPAPDRRSIRSTHTP